MNIRNRFMVVVLLAGLAASFHADDCLAQSSGGSSGEGSSGQGGGTGGGGSGGDGASSASDGSVGAAEGSSGDSRGPLEKVNRHAIKSMVLVRQLLAQSNVSLPAAK